jgi:hypothetical protein
MYIQKLNLIIAVGSLFFLNLAQAQCPVAHTHIGKNPTWRPADWSNPGKGAVDFDPTDNNKLWFFSLPPVHSSATPGWPNWEQVSGNTFLALRPLMEGQQYITKPDYPKKVLYTCSFTYSKAEGYGDPHGLQHLNGWHSAHGPQEAWNLDSVDANTVPAWDIYLERQRISSNLMEDDFFTLLSDDTPTLEKDGDIYFLEKRWLADKNAWGIHDHMGFYFWLDEEDDEVYVVLSVNDAGGMYRRSADFVIHFAKTVVQPVQGDLNGDGIVDIHDLEILIEHWGESGIYNGEEHESHDHDHEHDED